MSDESTSPTTMFARFAGLSSIPLIVLAFLLAPFALPILIGGGITLGVMWLFWWGFTHLFTKTVNPDEYRQMRDAGVDPFFNTLGKPLNFDDDATRAGGRRS